MKIMLLAPGNSIHSQRFLRMLLDSGFMVSLVDSYNPIPEGANCYSFISYPGIFGLERLGLSTINKWVTPWLIVMQLRLIWRRVKPDIVHVHHIHNRAYQCALANLHPLILTSWGSDINDLFGPEANNRLRREHTIYALSNADHITADTYEILERCEYLTGKKLLTSLFYFGIDLEKFRPNYSLRQINSFRRKFKIPINAKVLLSVRRLIPMMGHHHILRAFAFATAQTNKKLVLIFLNYVDRKSDYENELRKLANELGVADRVVWLESVADEEMPALYSSADVIVNYPDYDGLPVSIFEAAACKKPIITNDLPAYREILENGAVNSVSIGDNRQLAVTIEQILTTPHQQLENQINKNYQWVLEVADQQNCINQMEQVYSHLIGK